MLSQCSSVICHHFEALVVGALADLALRSGEGRSPRITTRTQLPGDGVCLSRPQLTTPPAASSLLPAAEQSQQQM